MVSLVVGPKGDYAADTTLVDLSSPRLEGVGRVWNLTRDVVDSIHANPHPDSLGNAGVWHFYTEKSRPMIGDVFRAADRAGLKGRQRREFIHELQGRKLLTIREQIEIITKNRPGKGPCCDAQRRVAAASAPPAGFEPPMQVHVPSERLTAQWNLGNWHLLRHAQRNPQNGRLWFDDYPYGILAAETYLILAMLDKIGSHQAAADGFDQWLSLPLDIDRAAFRRKLSRPPERTLFRWPRLFDPCRRSRKGGRPDGWRPCFWAGLDRLGVDRALLD